MPFYHVNMHRKELHIKPVFTLSKIQISIFVCLYGKWLGRKTVISRAQGCTICSTGDDPWRRAWACFQSLCLLGWIIWTATWQASLIGICKICRVDVDKSFHTIISLIYSKDNSSIFFLHYYLSKALSLLALPPMLANQLFNIDHVTDL